MGTKDTRKAHGAAGKKDVLLFDDDALKLVTDPAHFLYDERVHDEPSEEMILNVMEYGVIEPIVFVKDTDTGEALVADGRGRVKACREANKRIRKAGGEPHRIPGLPKRVDAGTAIGVMITLNEQRRADTPMNLARKAAKMLERGKTEAEVGLALGRSVSSVKNLIALLDAPAAVRNAVDSGKITATDGYKLAKLPAGEAQEKVAELIEHAPRTPGKKRSKNAKKARQVLGTKERERGKATDGVRAENIIENVMRELAAEDKNDRAVLALQWVLGSDKALDKLTGKAS